MLTRLAASNEVIHALTSFVIVTTGLVIIAGSVNPSLRVIALFELTLDNVIAFRMIPASAPPASSLRPEIMLCESIFGSGIVKSSLTKGPRAKILSASTPLAER